MQPSGTRHAANVKFVKTKDCAQRQSSSTQLHVCVLASQRVVMNQKSSTVSPVRVPQPNETSGGFALAAFLAEPS